MATEVASDPQIAPDGSRVVWTAQAPTHGGEHPTSALWLADVPPGAHRGASGRRFSSDGDHRDHSPRWSPDGRTIAFLSDRIERGTDALFLFPVDRGEAGRLLARDRSIQRLAWSPDGTRVVIAAEDDPTEADERREEERDDAQVYGGRWPFARLSLVDVATGEVTPLPSGDQHVMDVVWSPAGDALAFLATPTPTLDSMRRQSLFVLHLDDHEVIRVAEAPLGTNLAWLDGDVAYDEPEGDLRGVALHRDGQRSVLALVRGTASEPWELWLAVDGDLQRVSDHQAAWRKVALATQEPFHWTAPDGLHLDGLVPSPPESDAGPDGPLPTVVLVHGGPYARWSAGFHGTPGWWGQWLATAGYRVLLPNPRGGMGHGNEFATEEPR